MTDREKALAALAGFPVNYRIISESYPRGECGIVSLRLRTEAYGTLLLAWSRLSQMPSVTSDVRRSAIFGSELHLTFSVRPGVEDIELRRELEAVFGKEACIW